MSFTVGQRVIVHDSRTKRNHRGIVTAVTGGRDSTTCCEVGAIVRWVDDVGRVIETHRFADELTPAAQVLGNEARLVWQAMRGGARKRNDYTDDSGLRRRRYAGGGVDLIVTTGEVRR